MRAEEIDFVNKLVSTSDKLGAKMSNTYKWTFGLSVLLFSISNGLIATDNELTVSWLNLETTSAYLLISLSFLVLFQQQYLLSLSLDFMILSDRIESIYKSFELDKDLFPSDSYEFLEYPETLGTFLSENLLRSSAFGRIYYYFIMVIIGLFLLALPVAAEISSFLYLLELFETKWWLIVTFIFIFSFQIILGVSVV